MQAQRLMRDAYCHGSQASSRITAPTILEVIAATSKHASQHWRAKEVKMCKRRLANRIVSVTLPRQSILDEYQQRAMERWPGVSWTVIDFGAKAGGRNNACFCLRLVAGWSRCSSQDTCNQDLQRLHEQARTITLPDLHRPRTAAFDTLGLVADGLRQYVCGLNGVMLSADAMALYAPLFAACDFVHGDSTRPATLATYKERIIKVGRWDFADELILAAAAKFLRI